MELLFLVFVVFAIVMLVLDFDLTLVPKIHGKEIPKPPPGLSSFTLTCEKGQLSWSQYR